MKKSLLLSLIPVLFLASCGPKEVKYSITYSTGSNYTLDGPTEVVQGKEFDFTLVYTVGYTGELSVTGASYQETEDSYHVYDIKSNVSIDVNNVRKIKFNVNKPTSEHFTVNGDNQVDYGDDYTFTVTYETGYKGVVKVNDEELEPVDNVYTVPAVKQDLTISVEASLKQITIVKPSDEGKKFKFTGESKVNYGFDYVFTVEFDEGYTGSVKANDTVLTPAGDGKTYTVAKVKFITTITVDVNFVVTAPATSDDYTFVGAEGGIIGQDYTFTVMFEEYKSGTVNINDNPAQGVDGTYTVTAVSENLVITVTDVKTNVLVLDENNVLSAYCTESSNTTSRVDYNKNLAVKGTLNDSVFGAIDFEVYNFQYQGGNFGAWRGKNIDRYIRNLSPINGLGSIKVSQANLTLDLGIKIDEEIIYVENGIALTQNTAYNITGEYCYFRINYVGDWAALKKVEIYFRDNVVEQQYTKSTWLNRHSIGTDPAKGEITNMCKKTCDNNGDPITDGATLGMSNIDSDHKWNDGTINGQYINTQRRTDETYTWDMPYRNFSGKDAAMIMFKVSGANFELSLGGNKVFKSYKASEFKVIVYQGKLYCDGNYIYTLTEGQNKGQEVMGVSLYVKDSYKTGIANSYAWFGMSSYFAYQVNA